MQEEVTPATCLEMGYTTYSCATCGMSSRSDYTLPLGHNYQPEVTAPTCLEAGYTTYTCANCGDSYEMDRTEPLGHEWNEGSTIVSISCNQDGLIDRACVRCDEHILEAVSAKGHTPGPEATCTEAQVCTVCGAVLELAKGHQYTDVVTEPTCTVMGYTTHTCSICQDSYKDAYTEATGHKEGEWVIDKEPTTAAEGSRHTACTVCGTTLKTESIEKHGV